MNLPRALLLAAASTLSLQAAPTVVDLGTLGGTYSNFNWQYLASSTNGSVLVGSSHLSGNSSIHAFAYTNGAMADLGTLGGSYSSASAVSANGSVIVGNADLTGNSGSHAFAYTNGTMADLGTLGGTYSEARAISANGSVIVGYSHLTGGFTGHAFAYTNGTMADLGTLGGTYSFANAVSANGSVIVGNAYTTGDSSIHGFIYSNGTMVDPFAGDTSSSEFFGVSADGSVAVGYRYTASGYEAVYYANGVLTVIPALNGSNYSYAAGVSADGSVIYGSSDNHAFAAFAASPGPATITTTINASDARVTGGATMQFQGGTFAPVGAGTLTLSNDITVLTGSTGTIDASGQNIISNGAVTINGTSLTLTGSATSTINLSGGVSGAGSLINAGGTNAVWGSYTGATVVSGGKLINVGTSQSVSNQIATGATLEFNVASGDAGSGTTTFTGTGTLLKTGAGRLVWGVTAATFSFGNGALIRVAEGTLIGGSDWSEVWTNNHSDLQVDAGARFDGVEAPVRVNRLLGAGVVSTGLADSNYLGMTVGVDGGSSSFAGTVVDTDTPSGALGRIIKAGAGELTFTGANTYSGGTILNAGSLRAGNDAAFGTGAITLNAGVLSSDGTTARTLTNAIVVGGNITLGDATKNGVLTLSGAIDLGAGATLTAASNVTLGGAVTSTGALTKDGSGVLKLDTTATVDSAVVVSNGLLTNNGAINGTVSVAANGILGGRGTIAGTVTVAGTLAPGNSPGVLTQTSGDANLSTGSSFSVQLGGTTAGNGDGFHDQYRVQAGAFNLANGVTLNVGSWVMADGTTTFVPARRDVFTLIHAANGISGVFSDMVSADYSQWLLYDNSQVAHNDGKLYGTGLNGNQTFAAYGLTASHAAIGASLWAAAVQAPSGSTQAHPTGFIYAGQSPGDAAIGLLTAPNADAYLASLSPEAYLAAGDYALTVARSVTDSAFGQVSLLKNGYWTLGAGYNRAQHGYRGPDAANDYELSGDTSVVTLTHDFGPHCSVGFFYGYNTGKTAASNARLDYRGNVFGLTSLGRFEGKHPITLKAAVVATDLRFDAVRNGSTANDQKLRSLSGQLTASIELYKDARLSFSPLIGYVQGRSTSDAFSEAGSGARLNVSAMHRDTARALAGVGANYILSNDLTLDVAFAYEHEFATSPAAVTASFADSFVEVPMTLERTVGDRSTTSASLGASWKIDNAITLRLGAEVRGNRELSKDYRYNVGLNLRF